MLKKNFISLLLFHKRHDENSITAVLSLDKYFTEFIDFILYFSQNVKNSLCIDSPVCSDQIPKPSLPKNCTHC